MQLFKIHLQWSTREDDQCSMTDLNSILIHTQSNLDTWVFKIFILIPNYNNPSRNHTL